MKSTALKDCPSCGGSIAESAFTCSSCNSKLGHCIGCDAWIIEGTECMDCGKSTAVRVRKATLAASEKEPPKIRLDAVPAVGLLPLLALRAASAAVCVVAIVAAVASSPLGKVSAF